MYRKRSDRCRSRSMRTTTHALRRGGPEVPEDLGELGGRSGLEMVVATDVGLPIGAPTQKDSPVPEAIALQVVVLHLAYALDPQRLPSEILARAPAALRARHADGAIGRLRPLSPGMRCDRVPP